MRPLPSSRTLSIRLALVAALLAPGAMRADNNPAKKAATDRVTEASFKSGGVDIQARVYKPVGAGKFPAVIILHGCDGWEPMRGFDFAAEGLTASGHVVILIRYYDRTDTPDRITPEQRAEFVRWLRGDAAGEKDCAARRHFGQWVGTVRDAVAYARTLPNVDGDRVAIAGFSLGGYLALASAPTCDPPVRAVVGMFGGLPAESRTKLGKVPPALLVHGDRDEVVSVNETYKAAGIILAQKQHVQVEIHAGLGHVLVDPKTGEPNKWELLKARANMVTFLKKHLATPDARVSLNRP